MTPADPRMCGFAERVPVATALERLLARVAPLAPESVPVTEAADRVAAVEVRARIAVPHFPRAMMDGYAVAAASTTSASETRPRSLSVIGEVRAGHAYDGSLVRPGDAVRITTGAALPPGADAVLMAELTDPGRDGEVQAVAAVPPGKHVAPVGEDVDEGAVVLHAGRRLRPQDAGVVASVGVGAVAVVRRPRVRILITGDELLAPGAMPEGPRVVDSNSLVLHALCRRDGAAAVEIVRLPDDPRAIETAMREPADLTLVTGGSSVGPEDHAPRVLAALGELTVHGVAMRPSGPAGFGFIGPRPVFLLPGNPVSCLCAYAFFAGPALRRLGGRSVAWPERSVRARLTRKVSSPLGRTDYLRVRLTPDGDGWNAHPVMLSGASILSSTTEADGAVIVDEGSEGHAEGDEVLVYRYDEAS